MKNILFLLLVLLGSVSCHRADSGLGRIVETQSVPVFSDPAGAKVFVNGVEMGVTPISLTLRTDRNHSVGILKHGYVLQTILLVRETDGSRLTPEVIDVELKARS